MSGFFALLGAGWSFIGRLAAKLPWQVWAGIAAIAAVLIGWHVVNVKARHAYSDGFTTAKAEDKAAIDKLRDHAIALRSNVESLGAATAQALREEHDAKISSVGSAVADTIMRGPGKARCGFVNPAGAPALSSGQVAPPGAGAPTVDPVPSGGGPVLIAVPFTDFVRLSGQCDIIRDEAAKARMNDDKQRSIWEAYRKSLATPPK